MEEILKKIIDIDERAKKIRKETETLVATQDEELEKQMKQLESDLLSRAEKEGEEAYETFIKEGEEEVTKILKQGEERIRQLEAYFNEHGKDLEKKGFHMVFKQQ